MTEAFSKILSPVYFDETSPAALDYARHFAQQNQGTVYLLHVIPTDEIHLHSKVYRAEESGGADTVRAEKVAREKLQEIARERLSTVGCEVVTRFSGDPATGILEAEKDLGADLVVMATHGRSGFSHLLWGSVAEKVVRESSCPVFTNHREEDLSTPQPFGKILVPVDIDEKSGTALSYARRIAEQNEGTVYPLHVIPTEEIYLQRDVYRPRESGEVNLVWAERVAKEKLQELAGEHLSGVRYEAVTHVSGDPAKTILEVEKDLGADLVVMATHGFTGIFHLILGSLTEKLVRESSCPVLSIRGG